MQSLPETSIIANRKNAVITQQISKVEDDCMLESIDSTFDLEKRIKKDFKIELAPNQLDLVEAIVDLNEKDVCETDARSGGKSFGASVGLALLSMDMPIEILITAPTDGQANRIIEKFKTKIVSKSDYLKSQINWKETTSTKITFKKTNSTWQAFSGSEWASQESIHGDLLLCDESQDISDLSLSQMLLPMIQSSRIHKVIKIGVPRGKNHFYRSAQSKEGIYLCHDWLHCPNLYEGGIFEFNGVKYPTSVLDRMPYIKWQQYFPNNPELWRDPPNAMDEDDFETQEEMKWRVDTNLFLNEAEQAMLIGDFTFDHLETEEYFFGLDIAGGKFIEKGKKNDRTELSIGRVRNGVTQKIACHSWQGDSLKQLDEILALIHPRYGKFHCKFGCADYGYNPMMVDALVDSGVIAEPVKFGERDRMTGKNVKNVMYGTFKFELQNDRFKYPSREFINKNKIMKNHFNQWLVLEEKVGRGINSVIEAPSGTHDDSCCADILLEKSCLTSPSQQTATSKKKKHHDFPMGDIKGVSVSSSVDRIIERERNINSSEDPFGRDKRGGGNNGNPFGGGPQSL